MKLIHRIRPQYSVVEEKNSYSQYKDNLSSDFNKSCGYCDSPDFVFGGVAGFQIDHFAPKSKFPSLANKYDNLVYCCPICNRGKSNKWPSNDAAVAVQDDEGFVHPCSDEYDHHLERDSCGVILSKTPLGVYMFNTMKLGLTRHQIIWIREELRSLITEVENYIDHSSELKDRYHELTAAYFKYDELLRKSIDSR